MRCSRRTSRSWLHILCAPSASRLACLTTHLCFEYFSDSPRISGTLCFTQEVLASHIANAPVQRPPKNASFITHLLASAKIDAKSFKMALYGLLVSAPLGHVLVGALQKKFAGKTSTGAKIGQILASNLLVAPIQASGSFFPCPVP